MAGEEHQVLVRDRQVALALDDVEQRLDPDELRERGRHDWVAHLGANAHCLLEHSR